MDEEKDIDPPAIEQEELPTIEKPTILFDDTGEIRGTFYLTN